MYKSLKGFLLFPGCTTNLSALTCHRQCDFENLQEKISVSKANKFIGN